MEYTTCKDSVMELISDGSKVFGRDYKISKKCFLKSTRFVMAWMSWYLKLNAKVSTQILKKKQRHSVLSLCVMSLSFTGEEPTVLRANYETELF